MCERTKQIDAMVVPHTYSEGTWLVWTRCLLCRNNTLR